MKKYDSYKRFKYKTLKVGRAGETQTGRPRKSWHEMVCKDLNDIFLSEEQGLDCEAWRAAVVCFSK